LERAARALRCGASVRDAAEHSGFNDPFHFSRVFKKLYGYSPSEFRRRAARGLERTVLSPIAHDMYWVSWYLGTRQMRREPVAMRRQKLTDRGVRDPSDADTWMLDLTIETASV
jgi:hypothetical protein